MPKGYYGFIIIFNHCQKRVVTLALTKALAVRQTVCLYRVCFNLLVSESTKKPSQTKTILDSRKIIFYIQSIEKTSMTQ